MASLFFTFAAFLTQAQTPMGAVAGIVRDHAANPLAKAIVTITSLDDKSPKSVTADGHGA